MRFSFGQRAIGPEWLDGLPPGAGRASIADLERINRGWGGYSSVRKLMVRATRAGEAFSLLDIGAASGDLGRYIQRLRPGARVTSLDRLPHHLELAPAPKAAGDAFRLPFADSSFDFVFSSLFLHHFTERQIVDLLRESRRVARRAVLAVDLERHALAYYFLPATAWLFRWDRITLHDGPVSVAAGFRAGELESLARAAGLSGAEARSHGIAFRWTMYAPTKPEAAPADRRANSPARTARDRRAGRSRT